jgi:hypothetical protein
VIGHPSKAQTNFLCSEEVTSGLALGWDKRVSKKAGAGKRDSVDTATREPIGGLDDEAASASRPGFASKINNEVPKGKKVQEYDAGNEIY